MTVSKKSKTNKFINKLKKMISENKGKKVYLEDLRCSYVLLPDKELEDNGKNILIVSHELSRTGAPVVAFDAAKVLKNKGYFVTVISLKEGPLSKEFNKIGIPVVIIEDMKYIQYMYSGTELFCDELDLDIFVKNFDKTIMVTATLYNFIKRYIGTEHKILWWIHEGSESYNILGDKMPRMISSNIKVLCGGKYALKQLENRGFIYYPDVLNYGVYDAVKKTSKIKKYNKITFMLAGTIGYRKGQQVLLKAINRLSSADLEKSQFIFIGDPYDNDVFGYQVKKEIADYSKTHDNVKLLKSVSREELFDLYKKIHVLVLASYDDPMPVVATENFMYSNICLCSDMTGTSLYITDNINGYVFKTGDDEDLSQKLSYIINNYSQLGYVKNNGREIFEKYFDINIFEKKLLKLLEEE